MDTKVRVNNPEIIYFSSFLTSIGFVYLAKSAKGVCRISFPHSKEEDPACLFPCLKRTGRSLKCTPVKIRENHPFLKSEIAVLKEYFNGKQVHFNFPLDLDQGTPFQQKVWQKLREIPYGECRSYKWVAEQIGRHQAARAVGMANNKNPLAPVIPCHRVVGSDGSLTGYASGVHIKKQLLEMEYTAKNKKCKW
ncbi:MAG: methylated-DNA--[protein]-cysteine S-methyltransferase [Candidatus Brocadia sp.]|nr:methylated-DNA--[protein]-cysteine S-methyltransferase [Candidatus Brocadia sp.]